MGENPKTSGRYWQQADQFGALITETMIANAIDANGISAREILLKYDGDVRNGYIGGMCDSQSETFTGQVTKEKDLVIWAGDSKIKDGQKIGVGGDANDVVGKNATFKVYADGRVVCSGVDSKINGLATSTSETYVDFSQLPQQYDGSIRSLYFDFGNYGSNIVLTNKTGIEDVQLLIDLPAYAFTGNNTITEINAFKLRGLSTEDDIKKYIKYVDKFKSTEIRVRGIGLGSMYEIKMRGCLSIGLNMSGSQTYGYAPFKLPQISYDDMIKSSLQEGIGSSDSILTTIKMNSINKYVELSTYGDTTNNQVVCVPTQRLDMDHFSLNYLATNHGTSEQSSISFDFRARAHVFDSHDQKLLINSKTNDSFGTYQVAMYHGVFWETFDVSEMSTYEMLSKDSLAQNTIPENGKFDLI